MDGTLTGVSGRLIPLELLRTPPIMQLQRTSESFFGADEAEHAVFDEYAMADLHVIDEIRIVVLTRPVAPTHGSR